MMDISDKIQGADTDYVVYRIKSAGRAQSSSTASVSPNMTGDTVSFSQAVDDIRAARQLIRTLPQIRTDKVAGIRRQIEAGTYQVDTEKAAANLIKEMIENNSL
ncbi:MAG: flagellar biosynthesis anti-sigma factor FlgM [Desulfobacteraceae bacterium]|nr:flagellar biosynthesis anti-sigma factor FlgM [Desulfobacteraceae bacterium]